MSAMVEPRISVETQVLVTEGVVRWLVVRVPVACGHPAGGVAMRQDPVGVEMALAMGVHLPVAARRALRRGVDRLMVASKEGNP